MSLKMGLLGRKIGMTQVFHEDGSALGVTAVSVGPCTVVGKRTDAKHGYSALQLGFEELPDAPADDLMIIKQEYADPLLARRCVHLAESSYLLLPGSGQARCG